jgi:hypothetical protein
MMLRKFCLTSLVAAALLSVGILFASCTNENQNGPAASGPGGAVSPAPSPKTGFEADLEFVRKGQYTYVWVFSRKDGKALDAGDAAYLRTNAPQVVDWIISDEGKRTIAGTNFDLERGNLGLLRKRFNVEDYTGK